MGEAELQEIAAMMHERIPGGGMLYGLGGCTHDVDPEAGFNS
jgi:hypothetical protein